MSAEWPKRPGLYWVRLAGNAVTPPAARDLITVLAESLGVFA